MIRINNKSFWKEKKKEISQFFFSLIKVILQLFFFLHGGRNLVWLVRGHHFKLTISECTTIKLNKVSLRELLRLFKKQKQ